MALSDRMGTRLVLSRSYSVEELFERIREVPFEAGHPRLLKDGTEALIVWPRMDSSNQIKIIMRRGTLCCIRSCLPLDADQACVGALRRLLCCILHAFVSCFGPTRKLCKALAIQTGKQINALRL